MSTPGHRPRPIRHRGRVTPGHWVLAGLAMLSLGALALGALGAPPVSAQAGATTTTLPTDNRQLGDIIPEPFTGMEPQDPGDPGGWLQVSLFFLLVGVVLLIVGIVWASSRRARRRRAEAGLDPVDVAVRRGRGVRTARLGDRPDDAHPDEARSDEASEHA